MIKTEMLRDNTLIKHYSDEGWMLQQVETGVMYADPVDIYPCPFTYVETDVKVETEEGEEEQNPEQKEKALAYDIITGVSE